MSQTAGVVVHRTRHEVGSSAAELIAWFLARDIQVRLDAETAERLERPELACGPEGWGDTAFIVTLGGDGTILTAARSAALAGIPILGVHMGRFGFIAETHPADLYHHLERVLDGHIQLEERMMVQADVWRRGVCVNSQFGLNDALVKSRASQLLQIKTRLARADFATYFADGIIVSTPTGSTAYSLSAGGPLVAPTVQAMIITPICPHTLSARPMVVPSEEVVEIEIETDSADVACAVDGVDPFALESGDRIVIRKSRCVTRLIVLDHTTFYRKVRNRYLYGERLNE
jgi:NAD+ kinase